MKNVFDYVMLSDVKSPVRASILGENWLSVSFFKLTAYRKQLPGALGLR